MAAVAKAAGLIHKAEFGTAYTTVCKEEIFYRTVDLNRLIVADSPDY
jgi:hypothetical protein